MTVVSKIFNTILDLKGSKGALSLGEQQLKMLTESKPQFSNILENIDKPSLDIAYKAKSNYNIALFNLKEGENSLLKGAVSVQNPAAPDLVVKYRLNGKPKGQEILTSNGFIDLGKDIEMEDIQFMINNNNRAFKIKAKLDDAINISAKSNDPCGLYDELSHFIPDIEKKLAQSNFNRKLCDAFNMVFDKWNDLRTFVQK